MHSCDMSNSLTAFDVLVKDEGRDWPPRPLYSPPSSPDPFIPLTPLLS